MMLKLTDDKEADKDENEGEAEAPNSTPDADLGAGGTSTSNTSSKKSVEVMPLDPVSDGADSGEIRLSLFLRGLKRSTANVGKVHESRVSKRQKQLPRRKHWN